MHCSRSISAKFYKFNEPAMKYDTSGVTWARKCSKYTFAARRITCGFLPHLMRLAP